MSDIKSINEPATTRQAMLTPQSINEPTAVPPQVEPLEDLDKLEKKMKADEIEREFYAAERDGSIDPDELEEEIEAAEEEGDFKPMHRSLKRGKAKR